MQASSQNGGRKNRRWTPSEQLTAEVAAACGLTLSEIGALLCRSYGSVQHRLDMTAAAKARCRSKQWHWENRDKSCAASRSYYYKNHEERKEKNRAWRAANRERVVEMGKLWRKKNSKKIVEKVKKWREANRKRHNENSRKWANVNREAVRARQRQWRIENPEKSREIVRRRRVIQRANNMRAMCGVTFEIKSKRFSLFGNCCAYCQSKHDLTVDHVLAVKRRGLDESSNIVPACRRCNASKNASPVESWYRRQPFFTEARWRKIQRHCPAAVTGQLPLAFGPTP
jgi:hypothetical protein